MINDIIIAACSVCFQNFTTLHRYNRARIVYISKYSVIIWIRRIRWEVKCKSKITRFPLLSFCWKCNNCFRLPQILLQDCLTLRINIPVFTFKHLEPTLRQHAASPLGETVLTTYIVIRQEHDNRIKTVYMFPWRRHGLLVKSLFVTVLISFL